MVTCAKHMPARAMRTHAPGFVDVYRQDGHNDVSGEPNDLLLSAGIQEKPHGHWGGFGR